MKYITSGLSSPGSLGGNVVKTSVGIVGSTNPADFFPVRVMIIYKY